MTTIIAPTIGRRVWYWPSDADIVQDGMTVLDREQPLDAGICFVPSDRYVNLTVADQAGHMHRRTSVRLVQPDEERPHGAHATWMPFQAGQARQQLELRKEPDAGPRDTAVAASACQNSTVPTNFWLVWNPLGHAPTHAHRSEESALNEAERLARTNPGQQFFVLQPTAARFVDAMHRITFAAAPTPDTDGDTF